MQDLALARFESPAEVREFEKGRFEIVRIGEITVGRATYEPGWKWSEHVGPAAGTDAARSSTSASSSRVRPRCAWTTARSGR